MTNKFLIYFYELRPLQWLKNLLVFVPIFFAGELFNNYKLINTSYAFLSFCLVASAVYIINDIFDKDEDKKHPLKKKRSFASGKISLVEAIIIILLIIVTAAIFVYKFVPGIFSVLSAYLILNILYSSFLKEVVFFDVLIIPLFYVLRVLAGAIAASITISGWLVLCVILATLFLAISKRKLEIKYKKSRHVLEIYKPFIINYFLRFFLVVTFISYIIYIFANTDYKLTMYSIPFVLIGLFRYWTVVQKNHKARYIENIIFSDKIIVASVISWLIAMYLTIYVF